MKVVAVLTGAKEGTMNWYLKCPGDSQDSGQNDDFKTGGGGGGGRGDWGHLFSL